MLSLFYQGGPLFMGILTIIFLVLIVVFLKAIMNPTEEKLLSVNLQWLKSIGTLALVVGILGQLIGLYGAFSHMEIAGGISPNVLAGGLKVSMITTLYGVLIYIFHIIFSMILRRKK